MNASDVEWHRRNAEAMRLGEVKELALAIFAQTVSAIMSRSANADSTANFTNVAKEALAAAEEFYAQAGE
jgi:hypothetical protein